MLVPADANADIIGGKIMAQVNIAWRHPAGAHLA